MKNGPKLAGARVQIKISSNASLNPRYIGNIGSVDN